jgi:hypothetical protein
LLTFQDLRGLYYTCQDCNGFCLCFKCYRSRDAVHGYHLFTESGVEYEDPDGGTGDDGKGTPEPEESEHESQEEEEEEEEEDDEEEDEEEEKEAEKDMDSRTEKEG